MVIIPKRWRELPLKERLELPQRKFNISLIEIKRIRSISNKRERLLEAARLELKLFGEIHTYLLVWIAGYGSDVEIRNAFGSTKHLREFLVHSPKNNWGIEFSLNDLKRGITLPEKITLELAEEIGIHLGDGNLNIYVDKKGYKSYRGSINGDLMDESIYHKNFVASLLKSLYNIAPQFLERIEKNSIETRYSSKTILQFKTKVLGLPIGSKKDVKIPKSIFNNNNLAKRCLVGIFDTDFHITSSLAISGKLHSLLLAKQIHLILLRNEINHVYREYPEYARFYIPKKFAEIIVKKWEIHNPKHISKFEVFNKFKVSIPFSTTQERLDLINGKIDLAKLLNLSKFRRESRSLLDSNQRPSD